MIETKAVFLREKDVVNPDPDVFRAALRKSYGAATDNKERDKGVVQLAKSIGAIVGGEWTGCARRIRRPATDLSGAARARHPARHAGTGACPGDRVSCSAGAGANRKAGAPLTIMTVQDLENLEKSIRHFSLTDLLASYTRECPDRMRSLHNFIAFPEFGKMIEPSDFLFDASIEAHNVLIREFFLKEKPVT